MLLQPGRRRGRPADFEVHPRLALLVGCARMPVDLAAYLAQLTRDIAPDPQLRVDHQVDTKIVTAEFHRHRVDEEGHVVRDDVDQGPARLQTLRARLGSLAAHADKCPALRPARAEPGMLQGHRCHPRRVPPRQVLGRDMAVVQAEVREEICRRGRMAAAPGSARPAALGAATSAPRRAASRSTASFSWSRLTAIVPLLCARTP